MLSFLVLAAAAATWAVPGATLPGARLVLRQALSAVDAGDTTAALSGDGGLIVFVSMARLVPADDNSVADIYSLARSNGVLTLETVTPSGRAANGSSLNPHLSADGRYLVFDSVATNLTPIADGNDARDVFVRDRHRHTTRRLSVAAGGGEADGPSGPAVINDHGTVAAFVSAATNLVAGDDANGAASDVYVVGLHGGYATRASVGSDDGALGVSHSPSLDASGRLLAFAAAAAETATSVRPPQGKPPLGVYVRDLATGSTTCVSCSPGGGARDLPAFSPRLSGDGRFVVFVVQSDRSRSDIVLYDRLLARATPITAGANARSAAPAISSDGSVIVFVSWASDLRCPRRCGGNDADENVLPDVYSFDTRTARFTRLSGSGSDWWTASVAPAIDARGAISVFSSRQPIGPEDPTVDFDLFVCGPACT